MLRRGILTRQRGGPPPQLAPPLPPPASQVAFEERAPRAPLLVLPNGVSLPAEVRALKRVGFSGAIALHDALGVPSRAGGAASAAATPAAAAAPADASVQEGMLGRRQALADTFVRNMRGDGAAAGAEDGEEEGEDEGFEAMPGGDAELGVPLLVTTELAARGVDFKAMCASAFRGHAPPHPLPRSPGPFTPTADPSAAIAPRLLAAASPIHPSSPRPTLLTPPHPPPRPRSDVVFMLGLPTRLDSYVHVAGRTAREGRKGHAIALLTSAQQEERFVQYKRELGLKAEVIDLRFL